MGNTQSNPQQQSPSNKQTSPKKPPFTKKLKSSITSLFKPFSSSSSSSGSKVQSATLPMRKHIPLSQRGTPLAMNCFQNYIVIVTPQELVEFQNTYPIDLQNKMRKVSTHTPFTAAKLTYSQFFKSQVAFISTADNKISVFNLNQLTQIYALDVGGGSKIVSIEIQKLSDTFWLGFEHGVAQCWTFGNSECKTKYIPVEGRQMMPVAKIDFSRAMQLLMIMHQKVKIERYIKAFGITDNLMTKKLKKKGVREQQGQQIEEFKQEEQTMGEDDDTFKLQQDAERGVRVYDALTGCAYGILQLDYSQNQALLKNTVIVDFVVIQSKNLVILQGSIANLLVFYDLQKLKIECQNRSMMGEDHGGRVFELKPVIQHSATYQGINSNLAVTSLCIARTDDSNYHLREALIDIDKKKEEGNNEWRNVGDPVLILGLENGSALTCLVKILHIENDQEKEIISQIQIKPQQFYKPKGVALMLENKSIESSVNGFIPPVLHTKLLQYCSHQDILLCSNQGCIISILPGMLRTIERTQKGQKFQQIGFKQSKTKKESLPLFSFNTDREKQKLKKKKQPEKKQEKKLKFLSLGEKNDETMKNINWKGMVSSVKNLMRVQKQPRRDGNNEIIQKNEDDKNNQQLQGNKDQEQLQEIKNQQDIYPQNNRNLIHQKKNDPQQQFGNKVQDDKVLEILNRYSKQFTHIQEEKDQEKQQDEDNENPTIEQQQQQQQQPEINYRSSSIQQIDLS